MAASVAMRPCLISVWRRCAFLQRPSAAGSEEASTLAAEAPERAADARHHGQSAVRDLCARFAVYAA
eukprot:1423478-Heterocapsa_arctica.AAC.1